MDIEEQLARIQTSYDSIKEAATTGYLLFADLADSTPFKRKHPEPTWLKRLFEFRQAVVRSLGVLKPTKFLGDGVLCFFGETDTQAADAISVAERILEEIQNTNRLQQYSLEYALEVRIVLDYGKVFLFDRGDGHIDDPQGTSVDRLFRVEKFIPTGCIGFTDHFLQKASLQDTYAIGRYRLKGLGEERHTIHLLEEPPKDARLMISSQREISALADIWDLGRDGEGEVLIVGGYIPPDEHDRLATVQMGDKDALVDTVMNFARIGRIVKTLKNYSRMGRIDGVRVVLSSEVSEELLHENIVCVGGPYHNGCTLRMMREVKSPYIFDMTQEDTPLENQLDKEVHSVSYEHGRITKDYGFFARFSNPLNEERHVILACGIETYGVHGAVRAFSGAKSNAHFIALHDAIRDRMRRSGVFTDQLEFFCLLEFEVEISGQLRIPSLDTQLRGLTVSWRDESEWSLQEPPHRDEI